VHALLTERETASPSELGKLAALSGVREFPARVKCASLCWHTLNAALDHGGTVTTEIADEVASDLGQRMPGEP